MNKLFAFFFTSLMFAFAPTGAIAQDSSGDFQFACIGDVWIANYQGAEWVLLDGTAPIDCTPPKEAIAPSDLTIIKSGNLEAIQSGVDAWTWIKVPESKEG